MLGVPGAGTGVPGLTDGDVRSAQFNGPRGVTTDHAGNIVVADTFNNRICRINPDRTVSTLAGTGVPGFADGDAHGAQFNSPRGVTTDLAGNIIVADTYNHRIRLISPNHTVSTLAGTGDCGFANGDAQDAQFHHPTGVTMGQGMRQGSIIVADWENHRIRVISIIQ